jgi:PAS domain S-box-containing protein
MERSRGHRALTGIANVLVNNDDAAWRFLDAVWEVPVGLGLCDAELRFVRVNQGLADFDGVSVSGHYDDDVLERMPPELACGLRRAIEGAAHDVDFVSAGRDVLVKLHSILRPSDRAPIGIGLVALDVTDQRKAYRAAEEANRLVTDLLADATAKELALSHLIESIQEGLLIVGVDGRMSQVNRAAERVMGHPREVLIGAAFEDERWWCADGSGNRDAAALFARALQQSDVFRSELHVETDGGRTALVAEATALRDARGSADCVAVSLRDVTDDRRDLDLARSNLEFQQQIIAIVGHDLRNPLATIIGSIGLLRRQAGLTPASIASLDRLARSSARMARLISNLLDYARTRRPGGLPVVLSWANLHAICKDSVDECRAAHPSAVVVLKTTGDATGSWDADRIEQALTNLIVNAIEHGEQAPVIVESIATAPRLVEIKVHNRGTVIPADVLPELFKAYRRGVRGERSGPPGSMGLGLFIVAQIAAAHSGRVYAESSNESGTTFTIELPRVASRKGP